MKSEEKQKAVLDPCNYDNKYFWDQLNSSQRLKLMDLLKSPISAVEVVQAIDPVGRTCCFYNLMQLSALLEKHQDQQLAQAVQQAIFCSQKDGPYHRVSGDLVSVDLRGLGVANNVDLKAILTETEYQLRRFSSCKAISIDLSNAWLTAEQTQQIYQLIQGCSVKELTVVMQQEFLGQEQGEDAAKELVVKLIQGVNQSNQQLKLDAGSLIFSPDHAADIVKAILARADSKRQGTIVLNTDFSEEANQSSYDYLLKTLQSYYHNSSHVTVFIEQLPYAPSRTSSKFSPSPVTTYDLRLGS